MIGCEGRCRTNASVFQRGDAYREWLEVIERHSFEEVLALLVDPSQEGMRLRQSTPFAGMLGKAEREAITRKVSSVH
jgi:hypothetical protein